MDLQEITTLCNLLLEAEQLAEAQEALLSATNARIRTLKEETIPMAFQELGLDTIVLTSGEKVKTSQEVYASIPVAMKETAFAWLEENSFGGLIKTTVDAQFEKGEADKAREILVMLEELGVHASLSRGVHAQTLKAWAKEQIAAGVNIPQDTFGIRPTWTTKITRPK